MSSIQDQDNEMITNESDNIQSEVSQHSDSVFSPDEEKIKSLEAELAKMIDIAKMAQSNYLRTKMDFDSYQTRMMTQTEEEKLLIVFEMMRKFAPVVDDIKIILNHVAIDQTDNEVIKGLRMVYDNILKIRNNYKITPIQSLWIDLDPELHEPIGFLPTEDIALKGKVVQELSTGYIYQNKDEYKIVIPSKVMLGEYIIKNND
jgi:molecular chaperone GrpE